MNKCLFFVVAILVLQGCATNLTISPFVLEDQASFYKDGAKIVISPQKNLVVARVLKERITSLERMTFIIMVENTTHTPFDFSTENISVSLDGNSLKVFSYEELVAEVEAQRRSMALAAALGAVSRQMQVNQAGQQYHQGTINTNYYNPYGYRGQSTGTYSGYTYDPNATLQAQLASNAQTARDAEMIKGHAETQLAELNNTMLKKETVFPGCCTGGYIKTSPPPMPITDKSRVLVQVMISSDETHCFEFELRKMINK